MLETRNLGKNSLYLGRIFRRKFAEFMRNSQEILEETSKNYYQKLRKNPDKNLPEILEEILQKSRQKLCKVFVRKFLQNSRIKLLVENLKEILQSSRQKLRRFCLKFQKKLRIIYLKLKEFVGIIK